MVANTLKPVEIPPSETTPEADSGQVTVPEQFNGNIGKPVAKVQADIEATAQGPDHPDPERVERQPAKAENEDPVARTTDETESDDRNLRKAEARSGSIDDDGKVDRNRREDTINTEEAGPPDPDASKASAGTPPPPDKTGREFAGDAGNEDAGDDKAGNTGDSVATGPEQLPPNEAYNVREGMVVQGVDETIKQGLARRGAVTDAGGAVPGVVDSDEFADVVPIGEAERPDPMLLYDRSSGQHGEHELAATDLSVETTNTDNIRPFNCPDLVLYESDAPVPTEFGMQVRSRQKINESAPIIEVDLHKVSVLSALRDGRSIEEIADLQSTTNTEINDHLKQFGAALRDAGYSVPLGPQGEIQGLQRAPFYIYTALRTGLIRPIETNKANPDLAAPHRRQLFLEAQGFGFQEAAEGLDISPRTTADYLVNLRDVYGVSTKEQLIAEAYSRGGIPGLEVIDGHPLPDEFQLEIMYRAEAIENIQKIAFDDTQRYIAFGLASDMPVNQIINNLGIKRHFYENSYNDMRDRLGGEEITPERAVYTLILHGLIDPPAAANHWSELSHNDRLHLFLAGIGLNREATAYYTGLDISEVKNGWQKARTNLGSDIAPVRSMHAAVAQGFAERRDAIFRQLPDFVRRTPDRRVDGTLWVISRDSIDTIMDMGNHVTTAGETQYQPSLTLLSFFNNLKPGQIMLFDTALEEFSAGDLGFNNFNMQINEARPYVHESSAPGPHESRHGTLVLPSNERIELNVTPFNISPYISSTGRNHTDVAVEYMRLISPENIEYCKQGGFDLHPVGFYCTDMIDLEGARSRQVALLYKFKPINLKEE